MQQVSDLSRASGDGVIEHAGACLEHMDNVTVAYTQEFPPRAGRFQSADDLPLGSRVCRFLAEHSRIQDKLFSHQYAGIAEVLAGHHTVIATPTSSGKSLIFGIPVLDAITRDPSATALLVYPQKALANDQLGKFTEMVGGVLGTGCHPLMVSRYDGATRPVYGEPNSSDSLPSFAAILACP